MSHQSQLEEPKYRNWVKGALAYKYLKEGIEGFADDVVQKEHTRILGIVKNTSGNACNNCNFRTLQPLHISKKDHTGRKRCLWDLSNCNCLYSKKTPCPNNICDVILEEILRSHGSKPPAPNWKNTDVHKWYTSPWEIAKCFINAQGYANKTSAADIDASGLLHIFINTKNLHPHLSCNMTSRQNIFIKCREGRNKLFHSPAMEREDIELTECIDDIIAILEDPKEIGATADAKQAVLKLKELKQQNFIITTHSEAEVHGDALAFITKKEIEFKNMIQEATDEIYKTKVDAFKAIDDKLQKDLQDALAENSDIKYLKQSVQLLFQIAGKHEGDMRQIKKHLEEIDKDIGELKAVKDLHMEKMKYIEQKQALQDGLVKLYQGHYVKTSLSPLKRQENDVNIDEVYVEPEMVVVEDDKQQSGADNSRRKTSKQVKRSIHGHHDLFHSNGRENKVIYIVGNVGAGKSSYCQMMIQDWCKAVKENLDKNATTQISSGSAKDRNIEELKKFDFLFFLSFQGITKGFSNITEMIKEVVKIAGLKADFIDKVFEQDSERCLILADGLDEWTLPDTQSVLQHVSYGLPERGITNNATMVTFSRPSAKGILNLKRSECDLRVKLTGINKNDVEDLVKKYLLKHENETFDTLMSKIKALKLEHLESCPLLLQQLVWLYCNDIDAKGEIGKSRNDVYCKIVNIMFRWSENKEVLKTDSNQALPDPIYQLPESLRKFPSLKSKKACIIKLGEVSFESLTANMHSSRSTFSRSCLIENGFSLAGIKVLIESGILVEEKCFDATYDDTQLSFIHFSYLEFFAAVYASCKFDEQQSDTNTSVLAEIFQNCKTAADILQLSNLLKMICGLCPFITTQVSHSISDIVKKDEKVERQNDDEHDSDSYLYHIQELIFSFLSECDKTGTNNTMVYLADVFIDESTRMQAIRSIILDSVITLSLGSLPNIEDILKWMKKLKNLQYLFIGQGSITHEQMTMTCSFIQEALQIRCISLLGVECLNCIDSDTCHSIDLSNHERLENLQIECYDRIKISKINTDHLETMRLLDFETLDNIDLLRNSKRLHELHLCFSPFLDQTDRRTYNIDKNDVVNTLHQLQTLTITRAGIDENALTVTHEMKNLKHISLYSVGMSQKTWISFVDSLLKLQQSIQVYTHYRSPFGSDLKCVEEKKTYVERKKSIEIIKYKTYSYVTGGVRKVRFSFRTWKQY